MIVYLASAIDQAHEGQSTVFNTVRYELTKAGHTVYNPAGAWSTRPVQGRFDPVVAKAISMVNAEALADCDTLVAYLPPGVASIGVPVEIIEAANQGKRVIVIGKAPSVVLDRRPNIKRIWQEDLAPLVQELLALLADESPGPDSYPPGDEGSVLHYPEGALSYVTLQGGSHFDQMRRAYDGDAGYDLFTREDVVIYQDHYADIPCGIAVQLPPGTVGWVVARSSTFQRWGIIVTPGIIDEGFRGEIKVLAFRPYQDPIRDQGLPPEGIPAGTRLAQLLLLPNVAASTRVQRVTKLGSSERGARGQGSSGE